LALRLREGLIILGVTLLLAFSVEGCARLVLAVTSGSWPTTKAVVFDGQLRRLLRLYRRHPYLNTAPREGASAAAFGKRASFNSLGYRSPERLKRKTPGVFRILCSGGSTTFDILATEDEETWPWILETSLRDQGFQAEVFNAGFPGWTSLENLVSLAIRDVDLQPDVVVLFQGINDLQPASHQPFDGQYERGHARQAVRALGFELRPLAWYEHSIIVERTRDLVFGERDPWKRFESISPTYGRVKMLPAEALAVFERNIRTFVAIATASGSEVLLVTQPLRIRRDFSDADLSYLAQWIPGLEAMAVPAQLERMNLILKKIAEEGPAALADAASGLHWSDKDFEDPMHFSHRGSARLARFIADIGRDACSDWPLAEDGKRVSEVEE
jgi:lysophospholipase L1-like esterase